MEAATDLIHLGPLTFVFYEEPGYEEIVGAHCLELDMGGQGANRDEATANLQECIETYVLYHVEEGIPFEARRASPELANLRDRITFALLLLVQAHEVSTPARAEVRFLRPPSSFEPGARAGLMAKTPRWSARKLRKRLEELGASELKGRGKGSHALYSRKRADGTTGRVAVPTSGDVILPKTLASILKSLGLARDQL